MVFVDAARTHLPNRIETDLMAVSLAETTKKFGWGLYDTTVKATRSFERKRKNK